MLANKEKRARDRLRRRSGDVRSKTTMQFVSLHAAPASKKQKKPKPISCPPGHLKEIKCACCED